MMERTPAAGSAFPHLFSPISLGRVALRNRTVFQPHFTALGGLDGMPTDDLAAYHEERARGGVGLIVTESHAIHPTGKMSARFINAYDPAVIPGFTKITTCVHEHGAIIFGQLTHGGHTSLEHPPHVMWAPTQMREPSSHFNTKAMDEDDIRAVVSGFAASARNLLDAGFDGIEIKIAHDGLLRSFASPFFNRRTDRYGGSFDNRMRLSFEVIDAVKPSLARRRSAYASVSMNSQSSDTIWTTVSKWSAPLRRPARSLISIRMRARSRATGWRSRRRPSRLRPSTASIAP
jgi:2,4-dienoyl-CoA reductase-like NADH-dependent reductase (Old Yellow Enzyme family)